MPEPVVSLRRLNRTLLQRQLLLEPSPLDALAAVEHLVGLQAQLPSNPYLALRARLARFEPAELEALLVARDVVRMVLQRGTIHLVSTEDALAIRPVIQPVLDRELFRNRTWSAGLEGVDLGPVVQVGRALVEDRPMSLSELRVALAERIPQGDPASLAYAVRNLLPTLQVTPRGLWRRSGQARLTTIEAWAGRTPSTDAAPTPLLRRYLAAFGPATVADMQAWSGLSGLGGRVADMRPTLRTWRDDRGRELFDLPDATLADEDTPAPVRFLPDYDNATLSHADRTRILPALQWPVRADNVTAPVFLVDGFVAGMWKLEKAADRNPRPTLVVRPLTTITPADMDAVLAEAERLATFLATADASPRPIARVALYSGD